MPALIGLIAGAMVLGADFTTALCVPIVLFLVLTGYKDSR